MAVSKDDIRAALGTVSGPYEIEASRTVRVPLTSKVDDHLQQAVSSRMTFSEPTGGMRYMFEVEVVVEAPAAPTPPPLESLRIAGVRLIRGQTVAMGEPQVPPPGPRR